MPALAQRVRRAPLFLPLLAALVSCQTVDPAAVPPDAPAPMAQADRTGADRLLVLSRPGVQAARRHHPMRVLETLPDLGLTTVVPQGVGADALAAELATDPTVLSVEPDRWLKRSRPGRSGKTHGGVPTPDPTGLPYPLARLHAQEAWATTQGEGATVAVVDSGADAGHPDLATCLLPGVDATGGGDPRDQNGHGTHVAGLIAARLDPALGVGGVAPRAKVLPIKVMDAEGEGRVSWVARGILAAIQHRASVINLSLGGSADSRVLSAAVRKAIAAGIPVVAAMGNDGDRGNPREYPAAEPGVIAVGATDDHDAVTPFSGFGSWISVAAPGYAVPSTFPTYPTALLAEYRSRPEAFPPEDRIATGHALLSGTSQAAPLVSGVVALVRSRAPQLTPAQVRQALLDGAKDLGAPGFDPHYGAGLVDAEQTLVRLGGRGDGTPTARDAESPNGARS